MARGPEFHEVLGCPLHGAAPAELDVIERRIAACLGSRELSFLEFVALAEGLRLLNQSTPIPQALARTRSLLAAARVPGRGTDEISIRLLALAQSAGPRLHALDERVAARDLGFRPPALAAWLARELGLSFVRWRRAALVRQAVWRLVETTDQVKQVAYELGHPQPHQLNRDVVALLGMPPSRFRRCAVGA